MKVLRLSFKNLNSLAGIWEIDFRHPDYVSSGIFAITGPTGAGKTTILDAICLALYGQTPRLGRITQSDNEIMARQSGECFAEIEFETARGRFRCHWSQHRSRKLADGQLQAPKHEIAVAESGLILESKLRAVADKVEEVTGMDFDRFTRSMLLAQGGFAAFLQARPDERAPILEQITGTAIYSRISIKVHERRSEENRLLGELRAELDGIQLLAPGELEGLFAEQSDLQKAESALSSAALIIRAAQSWRERIANLENELLQLQQERLVFEERKEGAAGELAQLALAGRALKLGGDHAHILLLRSQQAGEQEELTRAAEHRPQLQLGWQAAFDGCQLAEAGLKAAGEEQAAEAELIRRTRELDVRLKEATTQLNGLTAGIERDGQQNNGFRTAITGCEQRLQSSGEELQTVVAFLERHQDDAGLVAALTGIEQQLQALTAQTKQCSEVSVKLDRQAGLNEAAGLTCGKADGAWQAVQQAVADAEERLSVLCAEGEAALQGRDLSIWRAEAETLVSRQERLRTVQEAVARLDGDSATLAAVKERQEELERKRQTLVRQQLSLSSETELREQVAAQLQANVLLLNRVRSLEEDRRQLQDGVPCPLCGASEHPYAAGNLPQADTAQKELELAAAAVRLVREQLAGTRQELVAVDKDLAHAGQEVNELQARQQRDSAFCAAGFVELGVSIAATAWAEAIRRESDACQSALLMLRSFIQSGEQHAEAERSAQLKLHKLKEELAEHDKTRLTARLGAEAALAELHRLEVEAVTLHAEFERLLANVAQVVAEFGYTEITAEGAAGLLAALTARRDAYGQQLQTRERLEKVRAELIADKAQQQALLAAAEKMLNEKEQELRDISSGRAALVELRLELYGERSPDLEEKRLTDALRVASERREEALKELNRFQAELDALTGQIGRLNSAIDQRGRQLSGLEGAFRVRLSENGFVDEAAYLQACLPQERFEALAQMADSLRQTETALQTRQQDRRDSLAAELARNLTDKPLDLLRVENAAVSGELSELHKGLGALEQRLQQHAQQQERHQSRLLAIERQRRECERWEKLHSLIGSSDGKKFRNFAQGLTFELMVAHANRQLQKMSDRYILIRDSSEPLELNVIDNYQAGEIRSTKNLSGGESFIASLALSLGLSSMASRNVRVDSLFLDEGFGTLDEDALETALETLSGLQQDGKLIGIISHVPALKERIGTQIQVEAGSGGRSRLSGPGCRAVD